MQGHSKVAAGNIAPARFVMIVGSGGDGKVLAATAGAATYGVSGPNVRNAGTLNPISRSPQHAPRPASPQAYLAEAVG